MIIRPAQARDLDACLALDASYETEYVWQMEISRPAGAVNLGFRVTRLPRSMRVAALHWPREAALEDYERGEGFLVAEDNDAILGCLDMTVDRWKRIGWIQELAVSPERRRHGIGGSLLRQALTWARREDLTTVMAGMQTKNYPGSALMQKHGFSFCGFNDRYYSTRDIAIFFAASTR